MASFTPLTTVNEGQAQNLLLHFSEERQFSILKSFWDGDSGIGFRKKWSSTYLEAVQRNGGDEQPYETIGSAAREGLTTLLTSRNLLPYGPGSEFACSIIHCSDSLASQSNDCLNNLWMDQKRMVIRYYYRVYNLVPCTRIRFGNIVGSKSKNKVEEHYKVTKNQLVAILIVKCAYGWDFNMPSNKCVRLEEFSTWPSHKLAYYNFVIPMINFVITEMNPHCHLDARLILDTNISRVEEYVKNRCLNGGIWSHDLLEIRLQLARTHPMAVNHLDRDVTKGIEFKFARLASLIIPNFKLPYNLDKRHTEKLNITKEEYRQLYRGYDHLAIERYEEPTYP